MKYAAIFIASLISTFAIAAPPYSVTLTNAVALVVPDRTTVNAPAFATNTAYVNGQYVKTTADKIYVCLVAGTSTNSAPTHVGSAANGTATFYRVEEALRKAVIVSNNSTNTIYLSAGDKLSGENVGIRLNANGGSITLDKDIQEAIWAGKNGALCIQEL